MVGLSEWVNDTHWCLNYQLARITWSGVKIVNCGLYDDFVAAATIQVTKLGCVWPNTTLWWKICTFFWVKRKAELCLLAFLYYQITTDVAFCDTIINKDWFVCMEMGFFGPKKPSFFYSFTSKIMCLPSPNDSYYFFHYDFVIRSLKLCQQTTLISPISLTVLFSSSYSFGHLVLYFFFLF